MKVTITKEHVYSDFKRVKELDKRINKNNGNTIFNTNEDEYFAHLRLENELHFDHYLSTNAETVFYENESPKLDIQDMNQKLRDLFLMSYWAVSQLSNKTDLFWKSLLDLERVFSSAEELQISIENDLSKGDIKQAVKTLRKSSDEPASVQLRRLNLSKNNRLCMIVALINSGNFVKKNDKSSWHYDDGQDEQTLVEDGGFEFLEHLVGSVLNDGPLQKKRSASLLNKIVQERVNQQIIDNDYDELSSYDDKRFRLLSNVPKLDKYVLKTLSSKLEKSEAAKERGAERFVTDSRESRSFFDYGMLDQCKRVFENYPSIKSKAESKLNFVNENGVYELRENEN